MEFPQQRAEIYHDALDILLRRWDKSRSIQRDQIYKNLTPRRKQAMFAHIAAVTFERGDYFIKQKWLEKLVVDYLAKLPPADDEIDGQQILKAIEVQHGIFVERAARIYSFAHISFLEYFTAKYIVDNPRHDVLKTLIENSLIDTRWQEVLFITVSLLDVADLFFDEFLAVTENLIKEDSELVSLLTWADYYSERYEYLFDKPSQRRIYYIYSDLARSLAQNLDGSLARDLKIDFDLARDLGTTLRIDLTNDIDTSESTLDTKLALNLDLAISEALDFALIYASRQEFTSNTERTHAAAQDLYKSIGIERDVGVDIRSAQEQNLELYNRIEVEIEHAVNSCKQLNLIEVQEQLSELTIPEMDASLLEWHLLIEGLQTIIIKYRQVGQTGQLTSKQLGSLGRYLNANILLIKCMKLAYMTNRATIEDYLLRLPLSLEY